MTNWQPYREPLRVTLVRTVGIAAAVGAIVAPWVGGYRWWPLITLLALWPSFGGHWIELAFLNYLRPRLPASSLVQRMVRLVVWFLAGIFLVIGVRLTATLLLAHRVAWLTWATAGIAFVVIELVAHVGLQLRGRPSFYNGMG